MYLAQAATGNVIPQEVLPYLSAVGHPLEVILAVYYGVRTVIFLVASLVAMRTADPDRRQACLRIAELAAPSQPRLPRLPGLK